uniref:Cell wall protein IFF6-like n=1 Tax=Tanacetum cinerariifolium TaxID=118510 RepID=A0A6L2K5C7_TANCI|nr:cell wall protein IFF6-like [Tanacetum cinerariifolium]
MTIADASNALRSQNSSGSKASTTQTSPHCQHLQGGSSSWSSDSSPKSKKKSVFTKVKEKAKKLKKSFSKRKHRGDNDLHTSCTTSVVEDDEKEQSEYFGSPLYEPMVVPGTDKQSLEESSLEEMQPHDKGVSVTGYLMHKFEPGEDERALSQVITQTIRANATRDPASTSSDEGMNHDQSSEGSQSFDRAN